MSCDARIMLPGNVRLRDVTRVIGVAVGFRPIIRPLTATGIYVDVHGVTAEPTTAGSPDFLYIKFDDRHTYWSFEPDTNPGGRLLMPRSTKFWCLVGHRLVDFFGGELDYNDCDDVEVDYKRRAKSNRFNCPTDGDDWNNFQRRIASVVPINVAEMETFAGNVGYPGDGYEYDYDERGRMVRGSWQLEELAA